MLPQWVRTCKTGRMLIFQCKYGIKALLLFIIKQNTTSLGHERPIYTKLVPINISIHHRCPWIYHDSWIFIICWVEMLDLYVVHFSQLYIHLMSIIVSFFYLCTLKIVSHKDITFEATMKIKYPHSSFFLSYSLYIFFSV